MPLPSLHGCHIGPVLERLAEVADVTCDILIALYREWDDGLKQGSVSRVQDTANGGAGAAAGAGAGAGAGREGRGLRLTIQQRVNQGCDFKTRPDMLPQL